MKRTKLNIIALAPVVVVALVIALCAINAFGTALSANRDTPYREYGDVTLTVKNDEVIYAGAMVAVDGNGEAVNASDTASIMVIGRAEEEVDNSDDGETIDVKRGMFRWANGDTVSDANIGDICYVVDNQTVSVTNSGSNSIIAGIVSDVDSDGVWVDTGHIDKTAGSFTTLTASGAATLGSTLGVDGAMTTTNITMDSGSTLTANNGTVNMTNATVSLAGSTTSDGGTVTTVDVNGGSVDGATVGAASASTGSFTDLTASGSKIETATTRSYTTNNTLTVAAPFYVLLPTGNHTQSLANPSAGQIVTFLNAGGATNVIFDDSDGNIDLGGGDVTLGPTDLLQLRGYGNKWYESWTVNN